MSGGKVGRGARSGPVANLEYGSVLGDSAELAVAKADREARAAGIVDMLDHFADALEADDPAPGPMRPA